MARHGANAAVSAIVAQLGARFQLFEQIGEGGFGRVYRCFDRVRRCELAVKVLGRAGDAEQCAFRLEYETLCALHSEHIVRAFDYLESDGVCAFSMEYLRGTTFVRWVREGGRCQEPRLRQGLRQVARALVTLHAQNIVHRDVKPQNLFVCEDGRVVLLDFGLATRTDLANAHVDWRSEGTVAYMAPEQLASLPLTCAADLYGLGVVCYESLTGLRPFQGDARAQLLAKFGQTPHPPSVWTRGVAPDLEALVLALLSADVELRPTAQELLDHYDVSNCGDPRRSSTQVHAEPGPSSSCARK